MNLKQLATYIEGVSARAAADDSEPDDAEGLAVAVTMAQQHYTTGPSPCGAVVRALSVAPAPSVREARGAVADALAALPRCSDDAKTLTPPEAAKQLGVKPSTVIGWIKSGKLKASNLSKGVRPRYRIQADDLAEFLEKQRSTTPTQPAARRRSSRF